MSSPELTVGGEGTFRTGLVVLAPELSVGGEERVGRGWLRRPRNYLLRDKERVGPGWLRLWGVAGALYVDRSPKGDAPSSLELTVGADGDAVEYSYGLPRGTLPELRALCSLPHSDLSREARNGKVLGGHRLLIGIKEVENFHAGRARFFC